MSGGVGAQIGVGLTGHWPAATGPTLIEQHHTVGVRIEEASLAGCTARVGSAVKVERGLASGNTAALPVHPMSVTHVEHAAVVWVKRWKWPLYPSLLRHQPSDTTAGTVPRRDAAALGSVARVPALHGHVGLRDAIEPLLAAERFAGVSARKYGSGPRRSRQSG